MRRASRDSAAAGTAGATGAMPGAGAATSCGLPAEPGTAAAAAPPGETTADARMAGALVALAFGGVWEFARPQASKRSGATSRSGQRVGKGIAAF